MFLLESTFSRDGVASAPIRHLPGMLIARLAEEVRAHDAVTIDPDLPVSDIDAAAGRPPRSGARGAVLSTIEVWDLSVVSAAQVSSQGDLASANGVTEATDVYRVAGRTVAVMPHTTPDGSPRIRRRCELPVTVGNIVDRIITDLAVFDVDQHGLILVETLGDATVETIRARTDAPFEVAPSLRSAPEA